MTKLKGWNSSLVDSDILLTMVLIPFFARLLFLWTIFFVTSNWTDPTVNHGFWTDFSTTCSGGRIWQQKWEFLAILGLFNKAMEVVAHLCFMVVLYIFIIYIYIYVCIYVFIQYPSWGLRIDNFDDILVVCQRGWLICGVRGSTQLFLSGELRGSQSSELTWTDARNHPCFHQLFRGYYNLL